MILTILYFPAGRQLSFGQEDSFQIRAMNRNRITPETHKYGLRQLMTEPLMFDYQFRVDVVYRECPELLQDTFTEEQRGFLAPDN